MFDSANIPNIPFGAKPYMGHKPPKINAYRKKQKNCGLNFKEQSDFGGICTLGAQQIIDCYHSGDEELSKSDLIHLCAACPYALYIGEYADDALYHWHPGHPYFLDELAKRYNIEFEWDEPKCFVYFVTDGKFVKIGVADNTTKRLFALQTGNVFPLSIICEIPLKNKSDAHRLEKLLHDVYRRFHIRGEWYNILDFLNIESFKKIFERTD